MPATVPMTMPAMAPPVRVVGQLAEVAACRGERVEEVGMIGAYGDVVGQFWLGLSLGLLGEGNK